MGVLKSLSESLAGRVVYIDLEAFNLAEASQREPQTIWLDKWLSVSSRILGSEIFRLIMLLW